MEKSLKEKFQEKRQKAKDRRERFQLILSFVGALFFVYTTFVGTRDDFKESPLYIYIIIFTIAYLAIFALFILIHLKNSKKLKEDTKNFKNNFKIVKLVLNLLFIGSSLLIFIDSFNVEDATFIERLKTVLSGALLVIKLISTTLKIVKKVKGQVKTTKKQIEANKKEKENKKEK